MFNEAGERKSDLTATFSPEVDAWLRLGRAQLSGASRWNVRYFKQYSDQGGTSTSNNVRLDIASARFSPYVAGGLQNTYDRASLEIDTRAHQKGYTSRVGTIARLTGKVSFDVAGEQTGTSFQSGEQFRALDLRQQLNRTLRRFDVATRYELTPLTRINIVVDREATSFEFSPERDSTAVRVTAGAEFKPLALVSGTARIGVLRFTPKDSGEPVLLGPIGAVQLGYTLRGTTRFIVTFSRELGYSVDNLKTYYLQTGVGLGVTRQVGERWDVGGSASNQRLGIRSIIPGVVPAVADPLTTGLQGTESVHQYGATAGYRFSRRLRLGVNADLSRRTGVPREEYENLRVFGTVLFGIF